MPLPATEKRINRLSIRDEVYDKLLHWIMEGVLRPGEKIVDKELAEHIGVSRTPVREAIRRLEDKGLVESSANRWTRVSKIPAGEPEMIYPIIWTLERLALTVAADVMTEKHFQKMEKANSEFKTALKKDDPVAASKADARFHGIFLECSGNSYLISILDDLKIRYRRLEVHYFEGIPYGESSVQEHNAIIAALRAGDIEAAKTIVHSNWSKSLERFRAMEKKIEQHHS